MQKSSTQKLVYGALAAALIMVATAFVKIPALHGYVHAGDGFVFLSAAALGPFGALAAAIGSMLADLFSGYAIYMLPTFLIKGAMGLMAARAGKGKLLLRVILFALAEGLMVLGYFICDWLLFGFAAALGGIIFNALQGIFGLCLGLLLTFKIEKFML